MRAGPLPDFPFRWSAHDRLVEHRTDARFLRDAWADPATKVLVMTGRELAADDNGLVFTSPDGAPDGDRMLLGSVDGVVHFLVLAREEHAEHPPVSPLADLRRLAGRLDKTGLSVAVHAIALGGWHLRHPMCAVCGSATDVVEAGAARRCPVCGTPHFPRTDPAVIMLVVDDEDRCLLGHNAARPDGMYSTLAGFVEPGESPEQAVIREVYEEAGIEVTDVTYAGSQPWPFPSSLMLGFFARAVSTDISVDGDEITEARWFTREDLAEGYRSGALVVPTTVSISGALITHWYGEPLPT